jgi:hypothetical protein
MSRGSRATQVKPEALVILFRATTRNRIIYAGDRGFVSACAVFPGSYGNLFFAHSGPDWTGACASSRKTVLNLPCAGE